MCFFSCSACTVTKLSNAECTGKGTYIDLDRPVDLPEVQAPKMCRKLAQESYKVVSLMHCSPLPAPECGGSK